MNSCVLMAKIVRDPELRSTQDGVNISSMLVEFPSTREGEAPGTLKVEGWGNLAEDMKNSYSVGESIIIEGRLSMNLIERDGYKEKRAALVASKIYPVGGSGNTGPSTSPVSDRDFQPPAETTSSSSNVVEFASSLQTQAVTASTPTVTPESTASKADDNEDWDEIPF